MLQAASRASADVLVVGGGIAGLAVAEEMSRRGRAVVVFDPRAGGEASWAAGGMLAADYEFEGPSPLAALAVRSRAMWEKFAERLGAEVGVDLLPRTEGTLVPARDVDDAARIESRLRWARADGRRVEWRSRDEAVAAEPALPQTIAGAWRLPDDRAVSARAVLAALKSALRARGVAIVPRRARPWRDGGRVRGVQDGERRVDGAVVVNAAGAWASQIDSGPIVSPVRGQMLGLLAARADALRHVVRWSDGYAVPRGGGRIAVGTTSEPEAGFDKRVTPEAVALLSAGFRAALPGLREAAVVHAWAGLRPATADGNPCLGFGDDGLLHATGLYRNGILLAPAVARAIADLAEGVEPEIDLAPFDPRRPSIRGTPSIDAAAVDARVLVNGAARSLAPGTTVGALLDQLVLRRPGVAVAVNEAVVRRAEWDTISLRDADRVEILHAVGGG